MRTYEADHLGRPIAGVEGADLGTCLAKHRIVSGNGEVAHHVQDVAAPYCIACHHGHHWLR